MVSLSRAITIIVTITITLSVVITVTFTITITNTITFKSDVDWRRWICSLSWLSRNRLSSMSGSPQFRPRYFDPTRFYFLQCRGSGSGSVGSICFGPPGFAFGSISQRYGSGFGSFYHRAKIVRKTSFLTVL
jgi:hypothetical protein